MNTMQKRLQFARKKCKSKPQSKEAALSRLQQNGILDEQGNLTSEYKGIFEKRDNQNEDKT